MSTDRRLVSALLTAAMAAFATAPAQAQGAASQQMRIGGLVIDGYYAYYRLETVGSGRLGMGGGGGRLMWRADSESDIPAILERTAAGLFAEYAPSADSRGFSITHVGLQGDVHLLGSPLFGRIDPVISAGAGVLQTSISNSSVARSTAFPLAQNKTATFAFSPAFGVQLGIWRQLGLRADVRDLMTFKDRTLNNLEIAGGASVVF